MTSTSARPTERVRVQVHGETTRRKEDRVIGEEPLEIRLAWPGQSGERVWVTMRTPGNDFELAAGNLFHEGLVSPQSILRVAYCTDAELSEEERFNVVTVWLDRPPLRNPSQILSSTGTGSSACGVCGKESLEQVLQLRPAAPWQGPVPAIEVVRELPDKLRNSQPLFDVTGGVHAAGLADADGNLLLVREDVGRHNAVDKLAGARLLAHQPSAEAVLVLSGRVGFELVAKAAASGIGAIVAVGAPTSLAVRLAAESGIALFGFTSPTRAVQYAG